MQLGNLPTRLGNLPTYLGNRGNCPAYVGNCLFWVVIRSAASQDRTYHYQARNRLQYEISE
jgi:hypothetical protein